MADGVAGFDLTTSERYLTGTALRDGELVVRPTLTRRLQAVPASVFAVGVGAWLVAAAVGSSITIVLIAVIVAIGAAGLGLRVTIGFMRSGVFADREGLTLRDRWRRERWSWCDVERFTVDDSRIAPLRSRPGSIFDWRPWPGESTPVLVLKDRRRVRLWVLSSTRRDEDFSLGLATPAEMHTGLLARYHAAIAAIPPTYVPPPPTR